MAVYIIKNRDILNFHKNYRLSKPKNRVSINPTVDEKIMTRDSILDKFNLNQENEYIRTNIKQTLQRSYFSNFSKRLNKLSKNNRTYEGFELDQKNKAWLDSDLKFDLNKVFTLQASTPGK